MRSKFITTLTWSVACIIVAALLVWHFGYNHVSFGLNIALYPVVAVLSLIALGMVGKYIAEALASYSHLPEDDKEAVRSFVDDCAAVKQGDKSWCDVLRSHL